MSALPLRPDLTGFRRRLAELEGLLADPATFADNRRAAALGAELRVTSKAVKADDILTALERELAESHALAAEADPEIRAMAAEEVVRLAPAVEAARELLIRAIIPPDPDDSRNALVEIRAGTGGEEASLFAGELLRAYTRFAEKKGWKHELMSLSHSDLGGIRDAVLLIEGEGATALLRHEAGVHRVQRVPATEASGRVHTSAATVAVLPEAEEAEAALSAAPPLAPASLPPYAEGSTLKILKRMGINARPTNDMVVSFLSIESSKFDGWTKIAEQRGKKKRSEKAKAEAAEGRSLDLLLSFECLRMPSLHWLRAPFLPSLRPAFRPASAVRYAPF